MEEYISRGIVTRNCFILVRRVSIDDIGKSNFSSTGGTEPRIQWVTERMGRK